MSTSVLKGAVIGLQHLHPRGYMPLFCSNAAVEITCAYDPDANMLQQFCRDFRLTGYTDIDKLLDQQSPDFAALFLPHSECAAVAVKCAERGIHLMIEKPISNSLTGAMQIADVVKKSGVKMTTGYCWRYHPAVVAMKEIFSGGGIGKLVSIEMRLAAGRIERYITGHSEWMLQKEKSGGGPIMNLGVHWLDTAAFITGDSIAEVCAQNLFTSSEYDIEESSLVLMNFDSGASGVLSTSYIVPDSFPGGRDLYIGLRGTKGVMSFSPRYAGEQGGGAHTDVLELYSSSNDMNGVSAQQFSFQLDAVDGYSGVLGKAYVENFTTAIQQGAMPEIGADDAVAVLQVVDAIYKSAEKKQWEKVKR
ncbi:MAG: Gfo/Idh/MocA family oxidoreductase [Kiritimatiellales bacterium]